MALRRASVAAAMVLGHHAPYGPQRPARRCEHACLLAGAAFFTRQTRLLNSQNGEYPQVTVTRGTQSSGRRQGMNVPVERLHHRAGDDITLGYGLADGEWLSLESVVQGGRHLRYERK
jgi:small ligand-binding sensory domain FIST